MTYRRRVPCRLHVRHSGAGMASSTDAMHASMCWKGPRQGFRLASRYIAGSSALVDAVRSYAARFHSSSRPQTHCLVGRLCVCGSGRGEPSPQTSNYEANVTSACRTRRKPLLLAAGLPVMPTTQHIVPIFGGDRRNARSPRLCPAVSSDLYIQSPSTIRQYRRVASGCASRRPALLNYGLC